MPSRRPFVSACLLLLGAAGALFITGTREEMAMVLFFAVAGLAGLVARPTARLPWIPLVLGGLYWVSTLLVHLPADWFPIPAWRAAFPVNALFSPGSEVALMPVLAWWWTMVLGTTCLAGVLVLSVPLRGRELTAFLHGVAAVVAAYALVSIFSWQTGWRYPFSQGDVFGLLPNRNHTATLLVVGAIVSFGLMQWELTHGRRAAATFSAFCGAPALAALLFFSISRAGVVLLVAGFVLWAVGAARVASNRRALGASAAVLAVFLAGLFIFGGSTVRNRLDDLWRQTLATQAGEGEAAKLDFRMPIFKDAARMIADAPLSGFGLGHFEGVFVHYRQASLREAGVLHPESDWLMTLAESGWPSALLLVGLVVWFFSACWRAIGQEDGLLRWTGASAVGMAVLHAAIDVPWRRPALGWFLLVLALAMVPPLEKAPRFPRLLRAFQILAGCALVAFAAILFRQNTSSRPPLAFRWPAYEAELKKSSAERKHDLGEAVAREAIGDFPLNPYAYLWRMGFLRTFLETEKEMQETGAMARFVDPVQPRIAVGEAVAWAGINPQAEAEARVEAVQRAAKIDQMEGRPNLAGAGEQIRVALVAAKERPEVQVFLREGISHEPVLVAYWVNSADAEAVAEWARDVADPAAFLEALPEDLRDVVLRRWITLPDAPRAAAFMEQVGEGKYWRVLSRYYAAQGDLPHAVRMVSAALGVPLDALGEGEMAALVGQGNTVAARRLAKDALTATPPNAKALSAAMAYYAAQGDWEFAWKAGSRLANEAKIGH